MTHQLAYINGLTLRAVRERRGVSPEYLCSKVRIRQEQLELWEQNTGLDFPTMTQAKSIARVLLCPLAGFYLDPHNLPVEEYPVLVNKRRIQDASMSDDSALHLAITQLMQVRSDAIEIATESRFSLIDVSLPRLSSDLTVTAGNMRDWIEYSLDDQIRTKSSRKLFIGLRMCLEKHGILVAQFNNVDVEELRGVALSYDNLPVVGVNAKDRWPAKCFSMIHELVHLSRRKSACCNLINIETDDEEEVFCNAVAGEFLFSRECASKEMFDGLNPCDIEELQKVANRYSVSRDVVARRLRDCGYLSKQEYEEILYLLALRLAEEKELSRRCKEVGNNNKWGAPYERMAADNYGSLFCELVAHGLSTGLFSERDACSVFGVKAEGLERVFREALG